jgi:hypothetical protein
MTDGQHISQEDLALHAMQSLSRQEAGEVRLHLADCVACRTKLEELNEELALLALSVEPHQVPEGARRRFLERISSTPSRAEHLAQGEAIPIRRPPARRLAIWIPWAVAAALIITVLLLRVQIARLNVQLQDSSIREAELAEKNARAQEVLDILTAPSAQRVVLIGAKTPAEPTGRAIYLASRGGLIFQASNLKPLPEDKTYELWVIPASGAAPVPAGLFRPDTAGNASVVLPPIPVGVPAKAFGVTIEKASGSETPTAPIILSGAAPSSGG